MAHRTSQGLSKVWLSTNALDCDVFFLPAWRQYFNLFLWNELIFSYTTLNAKSQPRHLLWNQGPHWVLVFLRPREKT